jgi:hypothetical protein
MQAAAPPPAQPAAQTVQGEIVDHTPFDQQAAQPAPQGRQRMAQKTAPQAAPAQAPAQAPVAVAAPTQTVGSVGDLETLLAGIGD